MVVFGRTFLALAAAIVLPTLIFASLQMASGFRVESHAIEQATLNRAQTIMANVDARLRGVSSALAVMTTIRSIDSRNWAEAMARVREIMALDPDWRAVRLIDVDAMREIFDTRRPLDDGASIETLPAYDPIEIATVGGVAQDFMGCACVSVVAAVRRDGRTRYLFVLALGADAIQAMTVADAPKDGVTAIVDAEGRFISRTVSPETRIGQLSSTYVRAAIKDGRRGVYKGVTLEGLENVTGFVTSPATGWSSHVAVSTSVLDTPLRGWWTATALAAAISLGLAAVMAWFGFRALAEQRRSTERLEQSARAEAIGKLAGGMAHDFNNMLTIVISSLELMRRRLAAGRTDIIPYVDAASEGAARAADLTRKMLAFSRRQMLEPKSTDVNDLVADMRDLLERTLPSNIRITLDLAARWNAHADPRQLESALLNLAVNARDAMPDGGMLSIATRDAAAGASKDAELERDWGLETDRGLARDAVEIIVRDSGVGMTREVAAQAFEPFFTTKGVGHGTGLGLSQVHGFAHQSGGRATLKSEPGRGTEVSLLLPRASGPASRSARRDRLAALPSGRSEEVVLVVEDEERVLRSTVDSLRELGYSVRHAPDGIAALGILRTEPDVRLLFTDIMMPGLNGRQLAGRALTMRPELKVLFATGYERDHAPSDIRRRVLSKPYSLDDLARGVRETLDE